MNKIEEVVLLQKLQRDLAYFKYDRLNLTHLLDLQLEVSRHITELTNTSATEVKE